VGPVVREALDSVILIDLLNGVPEAERVMIDCVGASISVISWIEVMSGLRDAAAEDAGRRLISRAVLLPLSDAIAEEAVRIRRQRRLKLPDAIILATARVHGLVLVTRNTKDFDPGDPAVRIPYTL